MTEYTPEMVAELVAEARKPWCKDCDHFIVALADALEAEHKRAEGYRNDIEYKRSVKLYADHAEQMERERDEAEANHRRVVRLNNDLVDSKMLLAEERDRAIATGERILADALKVSAERDRLHRAITEALAGLELSAEPDWPGWNVLTGTENILRAALDKEGNDDE